MSKSTLCKQHIIKRICTSFAVIITTLMSMLLTYSTAQAQTSSPFEIIRLNDSNGTNGM